MEVSACWEVSDDYRTFLSKKSFNEHGQNTIFRIVAAAKGSKGCKLN